MRRVDIAELHAVLAGIEVECLRMNCMPEIVLVSDDKLRPGVKGVAVFAMLPEGSNLKPPSTQAICEFLQACGLGGTRIVSRKPN